MKKIINGGFMEILQNVDKLLYMAQDNMVLSIISGFFLAYIESFIPMIPILVIGAANGAINGLFLGFAITWLGSCAGAFSVFLILKHLMNRSFFTRLMDKNNKFNKMIAKVKKSDFKFLLLFYTLPFLPSSLTTLAAAYCKIDVKRFLPPMVAGKFMMLFTISYLGSDYHKFVKNPSKLVVTLLVFILVYLIGKKVESKMDLS